jgi:hypothetical protein
MKRHPVQPGSAPPVPLKIHLGKAREKAQTTKLFFNTVDNIIRSFAF